MRESVRDNIINALARLQQEFTATFRSNGEHYKQPLEEVDRQLNEGLSSLSKNKRTLVTGEGAFSYLTREAHMPAELLPGYLQWRHDRQCAVRDLRCCVPIYPAGGAGHALVYPRWGLSEARKFATASLRRRSASPGLSISKPTIG